MSSTPPSAFRVPPLAPDAEALRTAYLQLLKLTLCDLTGASTREVRWTGDKRVFSRTLTGDEQLAHRAEGKDWPLDALTMVGLARLADLQECVASVVRDAVPGDLIEAGAWRGGASILIRATLDSLGARDRTLWVADSFQGFPPADASGSDADRELERDLNRIGHLAPSLETVREYFARFGVEQGVRFVPGFFERTLNGLRGRHWALIRLDSDTYRATRLSLEALYPGLAAGGYVVIDDYFHPYLPQSCRRAVDEFRAAYGVEDPIEQIDWNGARWRKTAAADTETQPAGAPAPPAAPQAQAGTSPVPTDRELELSDQVAALAAELAAARAEVARVRSSALRRLSAAVTRRRSGGDR